MGGFGLVTCHDFFIIGPCVCVLVGGAGSVLSGGQCFGVFMVLAWLWTACILMFDAVFMHCWRISMICLAVEPVCSWVGLGFSVGMEALG